MFPATNARIHFLAWLEIMMSVELTNRKIFSAGGFWQSCPALVSPKKSFSAVAGFLKGTARLDLSSYSPFGDDSLVLHLRSTIVQQISCEEKTAAFSRPLALWTSWLKLLENEMSVHRMPEMILDNSAGGKAATTEAVRSRLTQKTLDNCFF